MISCPAIFRHAIWSVSYMWPEWMIRTWFHSRKKLEQNENVCFGVDALDRHDGDLVRSREEEFMGSEQPSASHGYHRNCYARLTDKTNIFRAKRRHERNVNEAAPVADDPGLDQPPKHRRSHRAANMSTATLPHSCIICKSKRHYVTLRSGKRATDKLCLAETVEWWANIL